jgi:hypothetical protein
MSEIDMIQRSSIAAGERLERVEEFLLNNLSVPDRGCKSKIEPNIVIPMTRRMSLFVGVVPVFAIPTPEAID